MKTSILSLMSSILLLTDCGTGNYYHRRPDLIRPCTDCSGSLRFVTWDAAEYKLKVSRVDSQFVHGTGQFRNGTSDKWEDYSGAVRVDDIALVSINERNASNAVIVLAAGVAVIGAVAGSEQSNGALISVDFRYTGPPGGGNSCPYVYSWNGEKFVMEAEPFGIALGRALEVTTQSVLPSLKPDTGDLRIRIANERPETHYLNAIALDAIVLDEGSWLALDTSDQPWAIQHERPPMWATEHSGREIRDYVAEPDGRYWESDLTRTTPATDFEDVIDLRFRRDSHDSTGILLIRAINTDFTGFAFESMLQFLGDDGLHFMHDMENDPTVIASLREWIKASSINVFQWNGSAWDSIGTMLPEATAVPFTRAIQIHVPSDTLEPVRIRLKMMTGVWRIDALQVDWSAHPASGARALTLTSAIGSDNQDHRGRIEESDQEYAILATNQYIDVTFKAAPATRVGKFQYVLSARGYLHLWLPHGESPDTLTLMASLLGQDRVAAIENLLRCGDLLLPQLYEAWKHWKQSTPLVETPASNMAKACVVPRNENRPILFLR